MCSFLLYTHTHTHVHTALFHSLPAALPALTAFPAHAPHRARCLPTPHHTQAMLDVPLISGSPQCTRAPLPRCFVVSCPPPPPPHEAQPVGSFMPAPTGVDFSAGGGKNCGKHPLGSLASQCVSGHLSCADVATLPTPRTRTRRRSSGRAPPRPMQIPSSQHR